MQTKEIWVLGGSGFVGSAIIAALQKQGYRIRVLTRKLSHAHHLKLLPNVVLEECDIFNVDALRKTLRGADAVINLVGILHQSRKLSFKRVHAQLPETLANICIDLGIKRLIHMSSLGASEHAPSQYLRSKAAGEAALYALKNKLNITIFQPSIIFGRHDNFINLFAGLIKISPFIPLAKPQAKFQPVWVEDVADCVVNSLENTETFGKSYPLAGPQVYTFKALIQIIMRVLKIERPIIGLGDSLAYLQALMMEFLPVKLMSRDNLKSLEVDSVSNTPLQPIFNITPTALEAIIPEYLVDQTPRGAYDAFRAQASRKHSKP
jgi:NADH dehydrogenase